MRKKSTSRSQKIPIPKDVLVNIFKHFEDISDLCTFSEVCKDWYRATLSPILWKNVTAVDVNTRKLEQQQSHERYKYLLSNTKSILLPPTSTIRKQKTKTSKLCGARQALKMILHRANGSIISLDLSKCFPYNSKRTYQMNDTDLIQIGNSCPKLQQLRISPSPLLTADGFVKLTIALPQLKVLHMEGCRNLNSKHLLQIVEHCTQLEDISVRNCPKLTTSFDEVILKLKKTIRRLDISSTSISKINLQKLMYVTLELEELHADNCEDLIFSGIPPRLEDVNSSLFPNLKFLSLDGMLRPAVTWLVPILRTSHKLNCLSINYVETWIGNEGDLLSGYLPPLKHLSLAGRHLKQESWQMIFDRLKQTLVQCDVSGNISINGQLQITEGECFETLEELNLSTTSVTEESVRTIISISPKLSFIDVKKCRSIYNREFRRDPLRLCSETESI